MDFGELSQQTFGLVTAGEPQVFLNTLVMSPPYSSVPVRHDSRLMRDELRLAWKADAKQQATVIKSCSQDRNFPPVFTDVTGSHRNTHILLGPIPIQLNVIKPIY